MTKLERLSPKELKKRFDEATNRAVYYVRREYPNLIAVLVNGSAARGEPRLFSDIDLIVVMNRGKKPAEFSYFDGDIYVVVAFVRITDLEKEFDDPKGFFWARGGALTTRVLYDPKGILRRMLLRWRRAKPSHRILETSLREMYHNIIEYSGKMRNGWRDHDEYLTRYAARIIAQRVEYVVIVLNDLSPISENDVWHQVLKAKKKPRHFGIDYPLALAISGTRETSKVYRSAVRLCQETLRLIRKEFGGKARHGRFHALLAEPLEKHGL